MKVKFKIILNWVFVVIFMPGIVNGVKMKQISEPLNEKEENSDEKAVFSNNLPAGYGSGPVYRMREKCIQ